MVVELAVRESARCDLEKECSKQWKERGLIRSIRLSNGVRRVRAEEIATLPVGRLTGFAPLLEDDDVVPVKRVRSID